MFYINDGLYKKMYLKLFNAVTDAVELLSKGKFLAARTLLIEAQRDCEELYITQEE